MTITQTDRSTCYRNSGKEIFGGIMFHLKKFDAFNLRCFHNPRNFTYSIMLVIELRLHITLLHQCKASIN